MSKFNWKPIVTYCRQGTDHITMNLPCQDYVDKEEHEDYSIIAMADGLSSLYNSKHAASAAVKGTLTWFRENIDKIKRMSKSNDDDLMYIRQNLITMLQQKIHDVAYLGGMPLETLDCTLTFVLLVKPKTGEDFAYCGILGDGAICVVTEDSETKETKAGALTGRSTVAAATDTIMAQDAKERLMVFRQTIEAAKVFGFLLTTDGLDGVVYKKGSSMTYQALERYYNVVFLSNPEAELKRTTDELVKIAVFSDDISIAVLTRDNESRRFPDDPYWLCKCQYKNQLNTSTCVQCGSDYLTMYGGVDKSGYKNEADFFRKLNADPERQRQILGIPKEVTVELYQPEGNQGTPDLGIPVQTEPLDKPIQQGKPEQKKKKKPNPSQNNVETAKDDPRNCKVPKQGAVGRWSGIGRWALKCAVVVVVLTMLAVVNMITDAYSRAAIMNDMEEMVQELYRATDTGAYTKAKMIVDLEDGSIYVGAVENGVPNGYGMVIRGDVRECGQFVDGEPTGLFTIVDATDAYSCNLRVYNGNEIIELGSFTAPDGDMDKKTVSRETPLLCEPNPASEQIGMLLPEETVYLTNKYEIIELDDGQVMLCQVCTEYGYMGWCNAEAFDNLHE